MSVIMLHCLSIVLLTSQPSLRAAAASRGLFFGSQFKLAGIDNSSEPRYRETHAAQFSLSTVGNQCKWAATHPEQSLYNLSNCNAGFSYARSAEQRFRGHNLCWGNGNPAWLEEGHFDGAQLRQLLEEHITSVMRGVKEAAHGVSPLAWDVVNEATNSTHFFKPNLWYPALPDYVDVAFKAARAADNDTLLFYNDFDAESADEPKSEMVHQMVRSMVQRGIPIDGVGLQMHISVESPPDEAKVAENMRRLGALGLQVHVTEMDVACPTPCDEKAQASVYASMLRACLANKGVCTSFETWGFTDAVTWLLGLRCEKRHRKPNCHPLPFDEEYQPKPAVAAMLEVLALPKGRTSR
jgi:endo-1,4-beta-xylanase